MGILENSVDRNSKLLFAAPALPDALLSLANALLGRNHLLDLFQSLFRSPKLVRLANYATAGTNSTIRPAHRLKVFAGSIFVGKSRFEDRTRFSFDWFFRAFHGEGILPSSAWCVKYIILDLF